MRIVCAIALALLVSVAPARADRGQVLRLADNAFLPAAQLAAEISGKRLILLGEKHDDPIHRRMQLDLLADLKARGVSVALGLEWFPRSEQASLDAWIAGDLDESAFRAVFEKNWALPWTACRALLLHAREQRLPLVGLNVPRDLVRQVRLKGFASLSPAQLAELPGVACDLTGDYEAFIRMVHGAHAVAGESATFQNFCEAQMVWDTVMAARAAEYVEAHPDRMLVVVAGEGHAWKKGIPARLADRVPAKSLAVMLPEKDFLSRRAAGPADADYLWLDSVSPARPKTILFDQGHGQAFLSERSGTLDFSGFTAVFEKDGFQVVPIREPFSPENLATAHALVLSGPFKPYSRDEIGAIRAFVHQGGRLAVMLHIAPPTSELLASLGILHSTGVVREQRSVLDGKETDFQVHDLSPHPLTDGLTRFSLHGAWALMGQGPHAAVIARTSSQAWVDLNRNGRQEPGDAQEAMGLLAAGQIGKGEYAVFGDDALFQNRFLNEDNLRLARNLSRWLGR